MPAFNGPREVYGEELIYDWIAVPHRPDQVDALLQWLQLVCQSPGEFTSGEIVGINDPGRRAFYSDVPIAETRVTFATRDHPVPKIWIVDIDDAGYKLS